MADKTSGQKHAELKRLASKTQQNIYEMVRLASEILEDHQFVDEFGGEDKLLEQFQKNEFSHFGGSPSVAQLVRAYRKNPNRKLWAEYKFNVWAMIDLVKESATATTAKAGKRVSWKTKCQELEAKIAELEEKLTNARHLIGELTAELEEIKRAELAGSVA